MGWLWAGHGKKRRPDDMAGRGDLMERADHDRSAQAATPATAGTLDVQAQAAEPPAAGPGQAAAAVGRSRWGWSRLRERWLRLAAGHPVRREAVRLAGFIAAGMAVTWPLATD